MNIPKRTRRYTLLLTISASLLFLMVGYLFLDYHSNSSIDERFESSYESTKKLFEINKNHEKKDLKRELENIISIVGVPSGVADNDNKELHALVSKYYENLKSFSPNINILTFRSAEGITVYRAHKPSFYGDKLSQNRKLIQDTNRLKKSMSGFEVGKFEMTYRVTKPIFHKGEYVGNVEIGLNPTTLIENLKPVFDMETGVAIDKSLSKIMLDSKHIEIDENHILLSASKRLQTYFVKNTQEDSFSLKNDDSLRIKMNIPLQNHLNETLGYLIVGFETQKMIKKDKDSMYGIYFLFGIIVIMLAVLLYQGFERILKNMQLSFKESGDEN